MKIDIEFILNNKLITATVNPNSVLLDFLRKDKKLTGTKEVCKEGDCGACAVLLGSLKDGKVEYKSINSCLYPIQKIQGKHVVTIEGINSSSLNNIQSAFVNEGASQCGFCTPGFIISFTAYLINTRNFNLNDAVNSVAGNICRCTGYHSIMRSIKSVGENLIKVDYEHLIEQGIIPEYFKIIPQRLQTLSQPNNRLDDYDKVISGGTDLFVQVPENMLNTISQVSENIIDSNVWSTNNQLFISGSATVSDFEKELSGKLNESFLNELFILFASLPIRNSATIAGNIVNASPIADLTIVLLALDASLTVSNKNGENRSIKLRDFYLDYKKVDLTKNEFIEMIYFDLPDSETHFNFEKVSKRRHLDIASVNSSILLKIVDKKIRNVKISAGGVAPIPLFLKNTSEFMKDKEITNSLLFDAIEIINNEISPISDIRGSAEYKTLLLNQLFKAHFIKLFPDLITDEVLAC